VPDGRTTVGRRRHKFVVGEAILPVPGDLGRQIRGEQAQEGFGMVPGQQLPGGAELVHDPACQPGGQGSLRAISKP